MLRIKKAGRFFIVFLIFATFAGGRYIYSSGKQIEKNDPEPEITLTSETKLSNTMIKDPNPSPEEPDKVLIEGVPHIQQFPELPRGCEVTSLAMIMQYAGVSIDKMTLAEEVATVPFLDQNGVRECEGIQMTGLSTFPAVWRDWQQLNRASSVYI